jgi:hypothetical protein
MGISVSSTTTTINFDNSNLSGAQPSAQFLFSPVSPQSYNYSGYSSGSVDSMTDLLKGALRHWADKAGVKLSDKEVSDIAELMAVKMHKQNLDPNSAEYRAYNAREKELSQELIPTAARLASEIYTDPFEKNPAAAMGRMQNMMSNGIKNGIDNPGAWLKDFKQNLRQIPGWDNAPESLVDSFAKYVRNKVQQLHKGGQALSPEEKLRNTLSDYIQEIKDQSPNFGLILPQNYLPQSSPDSSGFDMDKVLKDFIIQSISDSYNAGKRGGGGGSGSVLGSGGNSGYSITISPAGSGGGANSPVTATLQCNPSSGSSTDQGDYGHKNASGKDNGCANNYGTNGSSPPDQGGNGTWFSWGTGGGGGMWQALLALSKKIADDYTKYCQGMNADKFDMQSAAEFQVKTMQFTSCFGAIMKALSGGLKQMKSTVDGVQP